MRNNKPGRPTEKPKTLTLNVVIDQTTNQKLNKCAETAKATKAEILRRGIHMIYNDLKKA